MEGTRLAPGGSQCVWLWAYTRNRGHSGHAPFFGARAVTGIALAIVPSGFGADTVAWGSAVNGVRLGAGFGADPSKPAVRVLFQNVGPVVEDVLIGAETGRGPIYNMKVIATSPNGKEREGSHLSAFAGVAGVLVPLSVRLKGGETHPLEFPLRNIIYASGTRVTLDILVKRGILLGFSLIRTKLALIGPSFRMLGLER